VDLAQKYLAGREDKEIGRDAQAWKLMLAVSQISSSIAVMRNIKKFNANVCGDSYVGYKKLATGRDFMTKDWKPWPGNDPRWLELLQAACTLSHSFDRAFFECFR
jgi:hypothetical protein